ncbi:MAG: HAD-IA family hydrolase [Bacteroidota bacterium]
MNTIKMAIFDMAGTVVDEQNLVYKTIQKSFQEKGFDVGLDKVFGACAGKEKFFAISSLLEVIAPHLSINQVGSDIFSNFKKRLVSAYQKEPVAPMPGSEEVFKYLSDRGILVVLNTGYDRSTADLLFQRMGWVKHPYINDVITATEVIHGRPAPDMIHLAMENANIEDANQVIKIGDSQIDVEEGQNAGCQLSIGITTGAHTREQLLQAKPDAVLDHLNELVPLLEERKAIPA